MRKRTTRMIAWAVAVLMLATCLPTNLFGGSSRADDTVVDYSNPVQLPWNTAEPAKKPSAAYIMGDTALGMVTYSSVSGTYIPQGTVPTVENETPSEVAWTAAEAFGQQQGMNGRAILQFRLGSSDPTWALEGTLRTVISLSQSPRLYQNESLTLVRLTDEGEAVSMNTRMMRGGNELYGLNFNTDALGSYALLGAYTGESESCIVTFYGPDGEIVESRTVSAGAHLGTLPEAPGREGYTFVGWFTENGPVDENLRVTSDVTIHASYSQDYPATVADAQTERVNVHVEVPEGALPADARFRMKEVNAESYRQAVETALGGTTGEILAVDMTFVAPDGTEYQPLKPVTVNVTLKGMADAERLTVVHIADNGEAEVVYSGEAETLRMRGGEDQKVFSFPASGFSVYAITDENLNPLMPRARYLFRDRSGHEINDSKAIQILKNTETLTEVEPPAPAANEVFVGWFIYTGNQTYGEQVQFNIPIQVVFGSPAAMYGNSVVVPEDTAGYMLDVEVRPVYTTNFATVYFMRDVNSTNTSSPDYVHNTVKVPIPDGSNSTEYELPDITDSAYAVVPSNNSYSLVGWSTSRTSNYYQNNDNRTLVTSPLTVEKGKSYLLYPVFKQAWIVSYMTAPVGSGADYVSPTYVNKNATNAQAAKPATDPSWRGYRFKYWTTTPTFDEQGNPLYSFADDVTPPPEFDFSRPLTENVTLYAYWESGYTTYTVITWKQQVSDNKEWNLSAENADLRTYEFESQELREGKVGETVTLTNADKTQEFKGFHHRTDVNKDTVSATVASSGATVLNVYYDRDVMYMKFYNGGGTPPGGYNDSAFTTDPGQASYVVATDDSGTQYALVDGEYVQLTLQSSTSTRVYYTYSSIWGTYEYTGTFYTRSGRWPYTYSPTQYNGNNLPPNNGTTYYTEDHDALTRRTETITTNTWYLNGVVYTGTRYKQNTSNSFWYTGLYGQTLPQNGYTWPEGIWSYYNNANGTTGMSFLGQFVFPDGIRDETGKEMRMYRSTGSSKIYFYLQNEDGSYPDINAPSDSGTGNGGTFTFSEKYEGFTVTEYRRYRVNSNGTLGNAYDSSWLPAKNANGGFNSVQTGSYALLIRYARLRYDIHYYDGTDGQPLTVSMNNGTVAQAALDVMYGASTNGYYPSPSYAPDAKLPGWVFNGRWYSDMAKTTQVFFHALTDEDQIKLWYYIDTSGEKIYCDYIPSAEQQAMSLANGDPREYHQDQYEVLTSMPMRNLALYAGFTHVWYWIKVDPNGGYLNNNDSTVPTGSGDSTWFWEQYGDSVSPITTGRTFVRDDNGTYYYHYDEFNTADPDGTQPATRRAYYTTDASLSTDGGLKYREADGASEGYDFAGWYEVHPDGSLTPFIFESNLITGNLTIRALWKQRGAYKVYYSNEKAVDKNGHTIEGLTVTSEGWKDPFTYAENSMVVSTTDTMASSDGEHYTFVGWYLNTYIRSGGTFTASTVLTEKDPTDPEATSYDTFILYPVFERVGEHHEDESDQTALILDANGGSRVNGFNAPEGSAFNDEGTQLTWSGMEVNWHVTLPTEPVYGKEKAEFLGWAFSENAAAPVFLPGQTIGVDNVDTSGYEGDNTNILYAVWRLSEISVRIRKVDHSNHSLPLQGAVFNLESVTGNLTSNSSGYLENATGESTFTLLTPSEKNTTEEYTLQETTPPTNYKTDGDVVISINYDGVLTYTQGSGTVQEAIRVGEDYLITVTNSPKVGSIRIIKQVVDQNGDAITGDDLPVYSFTVSRNGTTYETAEITGNGETVVSNLPIGTYTVTEAEPAADGIDSYTFGSTTYSDNADTNGVAITEDGQIQKVTVTNTYIGYVDVVASKIWMNGERDITGTITNAQVTFTLERKVGNKNRETMESKILSVGNMSNARAWTASWTDLPRYENGQEIEYRVVESDAIVDGETISLPATTSVKASSFGTVTGHSNPTAVLELTNTLPTTDRHAKKMWDDSRDTSRRPTEVTFTLTATAGDLAETVDLSGYGVVVDQIAKFHNNTGLDWRTNWTDLPVYTDAGQLITYDVKENAITDYTLSKSYYEPERIWYMTNTLDLATLVLHKEVEPAAALGSKTFYWVTIQSSNGKWVDSNGALNAAEQPLKLFVTESGMTIPGIPVGTYTVTELPGTNNANLELPGYRYDGTVIREMSGEAIIRQTEGLSFTLILTKEHTAKTPAEVVIENQYTELVDVTVTKTFSGIDALPADFVITHNFGEDNTDRFTTSNAVSTTKTDGATTYQWKVSNVPVGTEIQFTENGIQDPRYTLQVNEHVTTETQASMSVTATSMDEQGAVPANAAFVNTYTRKTTPVTLQKVVTGNLGNVNEAFSFTVVVTEDQEGKIPLTGEWTTNPSLSHMNGKTSLGDFPVGAWVTITETGAEGYTTQAATNGAPTIGDDTADSKSITFQVTELTGEETSVDVVFGNYANMTIATGINLDVAPYLLLLGLAMGGLILGILRRRKEKI